MPNHPREEFPQPHPKRPRLDNNPPRPAMAPPQNLQDLPPPVLNQQRKGYAAAAASIFFKTRSCRSMLVNGFCEYGDSCHFAHRQHELRKPPPNWMELVNIKDDQNRFHSNQINKTRFWKTRLCRTFQSTGGRCPNGNGCTYAHGSAELQQANVGVVEWNRANAEACAAPSDQLPTVPTVLDAPPTHVVPVLEQPQGPQLSTPMEGTEQEVEEAAMAKPRVLKKIAGVYGDWIEGYSL